MGETSVISTLPSTADHTITLTAEKNTSTLSNPGSFSRTPKVNTDSGSDKGSADMFCYELEF